MLTHEHAGRACVIEVDMREEQVPDVPQLEPLLVQSVLQGADVRGRSAVEERRTVDRLEEVRRDHPLGSLMVEVDRRRHAAMLLRPRSDPP